MSLSYYSIEGRGIALGQVKRPRAEHCSGHALLNPGLLLCGLPLDQVHFDRQTGKIITTICQHEEGQCQGYVEYLAPLIAAFATGLIAEEKWKTLFQLAPSCIPSSTCSGFEFNFQGSNMIRLGLEADPETKILKVSPCRHMYCDAGLIFKYAALNAYASGFFTTFGYQAGSDPATDLLFCLTNFGWAKHFSDNNSVDYREIIQDYAKWPVSLFPAMKDKLTLTPCNMVYFANESAIRMNLPPSSPPRDSRSASLASFNPPKKGIRPSISYPDFPDMTVEYPPTPPNTPVKRYNPIGRNAATGPDSRKLKPKALFSEPQNTAVVPWSQPGPSHYPTKTIQEKSSGWGDSDVSPWQHPRINTKLDLEMDYGDISESTKIKLELADFHHNPMLSMKRFTSTGKLMFFNFNIGTNICNVLQFLADNYPRFASEEQLEEFRIKLFVVFRQLSKKTEE